MPNRRYSVCLEFEVTFLLPKLLQNYVQRVRATRQSWQNSDLTWLWYMICLYKTHVILQHVPSILHPHSQRSHAQFSGAEAPWRWSCLWVATWWQRWIPSTVAAWKRWPGGVWKFCSGCISKGTTRARNMKPSWGDGGNGETPLGSWAVVDRFGPFKYKYQRRWPAVDPLLRFWWLMAYAKVTPSASGTARKALVTPKRNPRRMVAAFFNEFAENKVKSQTSTKTIVFGISQSNRQPVILHTSSYPVLRAVMALSLRLVWVFGEQANSDLRENAMWRDSSSRPGLGLDHNTGIWVHHSDLASPGKLGSQISWKGNPTSHCCIPFHHIFNIRINPAPV